MGTTFLRTRPAGPVAEVVRARDLDGGELLPAAGGAEVAQQLALVADHRGSVRTGDDQGGAVEADGGGVGEQGGGSRAVGVPRQSNPSR